MDNKGSMSRELKDLNNDAADQEARDASLTPSTASLSISGYPPDAYDASQIQVLEGLEAPRCTSAAPGSMGSITWCTKL
jgi:hypothetical protein